MSETTDPSDIVERLLSVADLDARAGEPLGKACRDAAAEITRLRAALTAERDGDVLVPKEPTEEMVKAGKEMMPVEYDYEQITFWDGTEHKTLMVVKGIAPYWKHQDPAEVYRAMIAAAIRARG